MIGDLDTHDAPCRFLAANSGVQLLAIDYRLAPEHPFPAAAEDAFAAYAWASANAARLGADPARIAVVGDSAGANLAAVASLLARDAGIQLPAMQLLIYPVISADEEMPSRRTFGEGFLLSRPDMDFFEAHYLPPGTDRADPRVSILRAGDLGGLPPAYLAIAGFDPVSAGQLWMDDRPRPPLRQPHRDLPDGSPGDAGSGRGTADGPGRLGRGHSY